MAKEGFKASKYFSSMVEVEALLRDIKETHPPAEYEIWKKLLGFGEQQGDYRELPGIGKIDRSIADFVEALNDVGMETLSSCSGLQKEHPAEFELSGGYIAFLDNDNRSRIEQVCRELDLPASQSEVYLKPALTVSVKGGNDVEMERLWKRFEGALLGEKKGK